MRVHLHDFAGHPFQVQLSRRLAERGHKVLHTYCAQHVAGKGRLELEPGDPSTLRIKPIRARRPLVKYSPAGRLAFEASFARSWLREFERDADVVVMCNVALFALSGIQAGLAASRTPMVLWHQDVYSFAIAEEASRKLPARLARPVGQALQRLERTSVKHSSAVVSIGTPFVDLYRSWGIPTDHVHVLPNWAPLDDIVPWERVNAWSNRTGLSNDSFRLMYSGTLGRKHNPGLLVELVDMLRARGVPADLIVVSEGEGADRLRAESASRPYVRVLPFQAAADLSDVLASGDVLVALLEPGASRFSVPSKVASYLAAGRPILTMAPRNNPCVAEVEAGGGFVVDPSSRGVAAAMEWLMHLAGDSAERESIGKRARSVAEARFDIERITDKWEIILKAAVRDWGRRRVPRRRSD